MSEWQHPHVELAAWLVRHNDFRIGGNENDAIGRSFANVKARPE
ncbi:MAG TPA: hypothetical protein VFX15_04920 [Actinomycetes bacterium]|nr:hypothetical protein [Actinomycetes bacterium]